MIELDESISGTMLWQKNVNNFIESYDCYPSKKKILTVHSKMLCSDPCHTSTWIATHCLMIIGRHYIQLHCGHLPVLAYDPLKLFRICWNNIKFCLLRYIGFHWSLPSLVPVEICSLLDIQGGLKLFEGNFKLFKKKNEYIHRFTVINLSQVMAKYATAYSTKMKHI